MAKPSRAWRDGTYISCLTRKPVIIVKENGQIRDANYHETSTRHKTRSRPFRKSEKFVISDSDGKKTCAIIFENGKIFVGMDVWRMSNPYDTCEYPYQQISERELNEYKRYYPECNWTRNVQMSV